MSSKKKSSKKLSLSEQIALLTSSRPTDFDPEDPNEAAEISSDEEATAHYASSAPSKLRKALDLEVTDPKYAGKKASRQSLFENGYGKGSDEEEEEEQEDENDQDEDDNEDGMDDDDNDVSDDFEEKDFNVNGIDETYDDDDDENEEEEEEEDEDNNENNDDDEDYDLSRQNEKKSLKKSGQSAFVASVVEKEEDTDANIFSKPGNEIEKGQHVKNQLKMWDSLLDTRIRLQRAVTIANRFPQGGVFQMFVENAQGVKKQKDSSTSMISELLSEMINLRQSLYDSQPEIKRSKKRTRDEFENPRDYLWHQIEEADKSLISYRNDVIDKWNTKVNASSALKTLKVLNQSATKQIDLALQEKDKLITRAHTLKASINILGRKKQKTGDNSSTAEVKEGKIEAEIFDDGDFYQQLLRELINSKTRGENGGELDADDPYAMTRQWLATQHLRKKTKKVVDTKASKGRKVRYDPHQKLVNFMVSVPQIGWHEERIDELFSKLFGKSPALPAANHNSTLSNSVNEDIENF